MTSKKTITNLNQQPQLRTTLFEPVAPSVHDLGNSNSKWLEIYVNRVEVPSLNSLVGTEIYIPAGQGGSADPPATQALNRGLEFYFKYTSAADFTVWQYPSPQSSPVQISPTQNSLFFDVTTPRIYFLKSVSPNEWRMWAINQS